MAKWHGIVGYAMPTQVSPGVWSDKVIERTYTGDVLQNTRGWSTNTNSTNDDLNVNKRISIVSDQFADLNSHTINSIEYMGAKWKVTKIDPQRPRLILTIGGVYNG